jgi:hypothetical protein
MAVRSAFINVCSDPNISVLEISPTSVMTGHFTFTSPSVYLAYDTISADGSCFPPRGTYTNGILTLHSSEVSSMVDNRACQPGECTTADYWSTRPFNFADLQGDIPASAYFAAPGLQQNSTIVESGYFPFLAVPTKVKDLYPEFAKCAPFSKHSSVVQLCHAGFWDPPIALTPTPVLQRPVIPPNGDHITAVPGQTPVTSHATSTISPQAAVLSPTPQPGKSNEGSQGGLSAENDPTLHPHDPEIASVSEQALPGAFTRAAFVPPGADTDSSGAVILQLNGKAVTASYLQPYSGLTALSVGGTTISPGNPPAIIEGKTLRIDSQGSIIVDGSTVQFDSRHKEPLSTSISAAQGIGTERHDVDEGNSAKDIDVDHFSSSAPNVSSAGRSSSEKSMAERSLCANTTLLIVLWALVSLHMSF